MTYPHGVQPITVAIREAERELSDAEWDGDTETATRARMTLASLKAQQARGEEYAVPF